MKMIYCGVVHKKKCIMWKLNYYHDPTDPNLQAVIIMSAKKKKTIKIKLMINMPRDRSDFFSEKEAKGSEAPTEVNSREAKWQEIIFLEISKSSLLIAKLQYSKFDCSDNQSCCHKFHS